MKLTVSQIAVMLDHSLLRPMLTAAEIEEGTQLALEVGAASVCVMPSRLKRISEILAGSAVAPSTVIGFPLGYNATAVKAAEARQALADGGTELDMVVNISAVLSGEWDYVRNELAELTQITHDGGACLKLIFENAYLADAQKIRLCELCTEIGVDYVKTSSGFAPTGATLEDIVLMRAHSGPAVKVKAAGGVRTLDALLPLYEAGATRFGATATTKILAEAKARFE